MRALVGLGNPAPEYAETRHNAGRILADVLAYRWRLPFHRTPRCDVARGTVAGAAVAVLKPRTYMNDSGAALAPLLAEPGFVPERDLLILVDDVALPLGAFRLRPRGSTVGHHGLESVEAALATPAYARLRIGVGPAPAGTEDLATFVLAPFTDAEATALMDLLPLLAEAAECWLAEGIETAMNRFNKRQEGPEAQEGQ